MSNLSKTSASILITDGAAGADLLPKALPPQSSSRQVKPTNIPITRKTLLLRLRLRKGVLGAPPKFPSCADLPEQLRVYRTVTRALIGRPISFDVSFHRRGGFGQKIRRIKIVFTRNANQSE